MENSPSAPGDAFTSPFLQHVQQVEEPSSAPRARVEPPNATVAAAPAPAVASSGGLAQAESYPFSRLCTLFEHLEAAVNKQQQTAYLTQFWQGLRRDESFFPYMRLLLPQLDNERAHYQLRESKLARLYVDVLGMPHKSADAQRLLRWKDPSKSAVETTAFSDAIYALLVQRGGYQQQREDGSTTSAPISELSIAKPEAPTVVRDLKSALAVRASGPRAQPAELSVAAVNRLLDDLAGAPDEAERRRVMLHLVRHTSALEQKWLVRIVLRDTRIRMTHQSMLVVFHPSALDILNSTNDLRLVCDTCVEDTTRVVPGSVESGIFLFQPLRPMLASPVSAKKLEQLLDGQPDILAQPKYDGERIMIHMDSQQVMYWTRNAKNYTPLYGPNFNHVVRAGFPIGTRRRSSGSADGPAIDLVLENVILDGEFLVYDSATEAFEAFGGNRTLALLGGGEFGRNAFRNGTAAPPLTSAVDGTDKWFCYMVFDIVMLNGTSLLAMPLTERQYLLRVIMTEDPKHIELVPSPVVHTTAEMLAHLEAAVKNGNEGIVLKRATSPYVPAERKGHWIKVKPDHIAGLADSLDLIVVGAYYGTKFGTRSLSHFLLATWANQSAASPRDPHARFHTFCKVGNGYTSDELQLIQTTLEPFWERTANRQTVPDWLDGWKPVGSDLIPDVYVHPRHSLVLEVFGYAFTDTANFRAGYTIRFPRMLSIRWDKGIDDATDLSTLNSIRDASTGALHRRLAQGSDELLTVMSMKWKRRRDAGTEGAGGGGGQGLPPGRSATLAAALPPRTFAVAADQLRVTALGAKDAIVDDLFDGYEFCVLFTSEAHCDPRFAAISAHRTELERCLLKHGARVVANPGRRTSLLLASSSAAPKVANWIHLCRTKPDWVGYRYAAVDVAHCDWAVACVEAGQVLPLTPRFMLFTGPSLQRKFATLLDSYEDSYTEPCTASSLLASMRLATQQIAVTAGEGTKDGRAAIVEMCGSRDLLAASEASARLRDALGLRARTAVTITAVEVSTPPPCLPAQAALDRDPQLLEEWAIAWLAAKGAPCAMTRTTGPTPLRAASCDRSVVKREQSEVGCSLASGSVSRHDTGTQRLLREARPLVGSYTVLPRTADWSSEQLATITEMVCCQGLALCQHPGHNSLLVDERGVVWKCA